MAKTIFITGASRGLGRIWTEAFLKRGDRVAATARNTDALKDLVQQYGKSILPIPLDVTDRDGCFAAIEQAVKHFGTIDVLINNAGYGLFGTVEETTEVEARNQIETNVFGLLWVTQAVLPVMRKQKKGHIIQVSSALGLVTLPVLGLYNASKFAVEGLSETLATEVKDFGINVTILEPNGFATEWGNTSATQLEPMKEYEHIRESFKAGMTDEIFGVPEATAEAIIRLVNAPNPPLRLFLGKVALPWVKQVYQDRLTTWEEWNDVATAAHGK
jgi:NAD(P)-dependent dehydrogenase (short-subunit alcohol dehydrogenase family)